MKPNLQILKLTILFLLLISSSIHAQQPITSYPDKEFVLVETTIQQQEKTINSDEIERSKKDLKKGFLCGDSIIDPRDFQSYATVQIGDQCWMANNLNLGQRIDAPVQMEDNGIFEKYCYDNDNINCDNYGGLYQWNEMMQYTSVQGSAGICPNGWKLPTDNDWKILEGTVDNQYPIGDPEWDNWSWRGSDVGGTLKEIGTNHWSAPNVGATNSSGFTAVAGGYGAGNSFSYLGQFGMYWSSTQLTDDNSIMRGIYNALTSNMRNDYGKALAIAVRCIKGSEIINEPPATPSDPNPANGTTGSTIETDINWVCTDPDGDPLTYDIYFGTQADPPLVIEGISEDTFDPGVLDYFTQYFWKIIAHDDHSNSTESPVWSFITTELFFMVTFEIVDEAQNPLQNAVITLNGVTNTPNNYVFDEVPEGTFNYMVELNDYITSYGQVTVVDQNVDVMVVMPELVVISDFPWVEGFENGQLPEGWRNEILAGSFDWGFALNPFPHTVIHNIGRPAVNARLITPMLDASDIGQITLGINQRFWIEPAGGTAQILISHDGASWEVIEEYTSSIGTGDDFQYTEFNISEFAAGQQVFICLNADFPDADATYEAVWEVESMTVYQPHYTVTFEIENANGTALSDAIISIGDISNPAGNYIFENIIAGTYNYNVKHEGYIPVYGDTSVVDQDINITVVMSEMLVISDFPYNEDFEENVLPTGWQNINLGDPGSFWQFDGGKAQIQSTWGDSTHTLLITPVFDCNNLDAVALGLNQYYMDIMGVGFAEILVSTDGENWITIDHYSGFDVGNNNYPYFEYYISEYAAGQEMVYIGFLYNDLSSTEFWWLIDQFTIFEPVPYALSVENLSGNNYVNEGESFTYEFKITNKGKEDDIYDLEVLDATWDYELSQENILISAGQNDTITVTITVPENINMGEKNAPTLKVTSQSDNTIFDESTFTTVAISTIKENYFEDFDLAVVPELPGGWTKVQQSSASWSRVQTQTSQTTEPVSLPNNIELYAANDLSPTLILTSPEIDESISLSEFRVVFWLRGGDNAALKVGTMSSPTGQFNELATFTGVNHFTWEIKMFSFEDYLGNDRYIAFKLDNSEAYTGIYLDDISIEIIPPPILKATPDSWDFGEYWVQYPSEVPLNIDLRNVGSDFVSVAGITLDNPDDFTLDFDYTLLPAQLYWNQNIPLTVWFDATFEGPKSGNVVIEYNDGSSQVMNIPLQGIGIPRPAGSTCEDPIMIGLPIINYGGSTQEYGNDYDNFSVSPATSFLGAYDIVFQFSIEEESYVNGSVEGPYYGPGLFILNQCPDNNNPPTSLTVAAGKYGGSFENLILPAGDYLAIISSPKSSSSWSYYTEFVLNLSATPTPDIHTLNFNVFENEPEQQPIDGFDIHITGFLTDLDLSTNILGQATTELYAGEYDVHMYKQDFEVQEFTLVLDQDTTLNIPVMDLIWTPHSLNVQTEGLYPGQALFSWTPKPSGEVWQESFEGDFPPPGWDTIVTNHGQVQEPGVDWKFTWQKYGQVNFSDITVFPQDGSFQAFIMWDVEPQDEWLITHEFEAPAGDLVFWYFGVNGSPHGDSYVKVSTDDGQTWIPLWNASDLPSGTNHYDFPVVIDLQPYAEQDIKLAWQAVYEYGLPGAWLIDNITIGNEPIEIEDLISTSKTNSPESIPVKGCLSAYRDNKLLPDVRFEDMNYRSQESRHNKGFSIYLDDLENPVAQGVQDPQYLFIGLQAGDYLAGVQAVYSTGQSEIVTIPFNNPVSGVLYDVNFSVEDEGGLPVDDAQINVLYAGETLHTLQTNEGMANVELYPGTYDFTVYKNGFITFSGQISVTNSNVNIEVQLEVGFQLEFLVKNTADQPIEGATVFCNNVAKITSLDGWVIYEVIPGIHSYSVTHPDYDCVLSSVSLNSNITEYVVMNELSCETPENLTAQFSNDAATLQWEAPEIGNNGTWIHWDRQYSGSSVGTNTAADFDVAQRFEKVDLRDYNNKFLTRVLFVPCEAECTYSIRVWKGQDISGPDILIVDQVVIDPIIGEWNEIFLQTPVPIDDQHELWFGFRSNTTKGYPAGIDVGPAIDGKGNMIKLPGNDWQTLLEVEPSLDYNWNVRGLVEDMDIPPSMVFNAMADNDARGVYDGGLSMTTNPQNRNFNFPRILLGYNIYRDNVRINPEIITNLVYTDDNLPLGVIHFNVTSVWSNGCESVFSNTATITNACLQYTFIEGWNSLSSIVIPSDPTLENMFEPIVNNLTIMQNLNQVYWPAQGINTIGNFNEASGYAIKVNQNVDFVICGDELAPGEIELDAGWHYLPVLSECEVNAMDLFAGNIDNIVIVQDLIGTGVFWPAQGIYTLETLDLGKAYKIKTTNPFTVNFPACDSKTTVPDFSQVNMINTLWGVLNMTPSTEVVAFQGSATVDFIEGDVVGAFGQNNQLYGYMEVADAGIAESITLFGNDATTYVQDGFEESETVSYKLYRAATGETYDLNVEYDFSMENVSGAFYNGSFAAIRVITMGITGVGTFNGGSIEMYPNPANNMVYISLNNDYTDAIVVIYDIEGRAVIIQALNGQAELNISSLDAGIYFVKFSSETTNEIRKLVIK